MAGEQRDQQAHGTVAPQAGHDQQSCPACGSPVDTMVGRRKSLGIFVPVWTPGPCRNRECTAYVPEGVQPEGSQPVGS
ncbi:hypothetical protein [Streptomyces sp. AP-93]|uniref:hypothetical protein n=1 Tax=Streptomyces sp. AP-93 TaxID=2929048 RepID=UPI001FAF64B4|nr:hypothetical protein [Streptomyces sp. AP-93]MCJ0871455.1 hypothetical protein [Streptomyces sp. AP-93]